MLVDRKLDAETLAKIPEDRRPEGGIVQRHDMQEISIPPLAHIENRVAVIFDGEEPETSSKAA